MRDRSPLELAWDEAGQLTTEYVLAILVFAVPLMVLFPTLVERLYANFYRIVGILSLPFA